MEKDLLEKLLAVQKKDGLPNFEDPWNKGT